MTANGVSRYTFDDDFTDEEERLSLGEQLWDPGTVVALTAAGVRAGWRCLEVGAGRGSIARWLAGRVGSAGSVTAVDLRGDRLAWLKQFGVNVVELDVARDPLPFGGFDLVHARLVLQHVARRSEVVRLLAEALRPGGILVIEDTDTASLFSHPTDTAFLAGVKQAAYAVMQGCGYNAQCGLLNAVMMQEAGLTDVHADGRASVVRGGSLAARWYVLWLEHLRPRMVTQTAVSHDDIDIAQAALADPTNIWLSQVMVVTSGRRLGYDEGSGDG